MSSASVFKHLKLASLLCLHVACPPSWLLAEPGHSTDVAPRLFGLAVDVPKIIRPTKTQKVLVRDANGLPVVGIVHAKLDNQRLVLLPTGQLALFGKERAPLTNRPFQPYTSAQLVEQLTDEFPGFQVRSTGPFIVVFNSSSVFAGGTATILNSMFPSLQRYAGTVPSCRLKKPEFPLVVVLYSKESEFRQRHRLRSAIAYYDTLTNRIAAFERPTQAGQDAQLIQARAIATIAHEGVHQIFNNNGLQTRTSVWPMWLSEGLAEYFAPTSLDSKVRWKGGGHINELRVMELKGLLGNRQTPRFLHDTVAAGRLTSGGYASAWALTHYLFKHRNRQLQRLVDEACQLRCFESLGTVDGRGIIPANLTSFEGQMGPVNQQAEERLRTYIERLRPKR